MAGSTTTASLKGTATSPPQTSGSTSPSKKGGGLGFGPGIGIGIVCGIIAGVLLAALVFFLISRRRNRKSSKEGEYGSAHYAGDTKKSAAVTISIPENSSAAIVENSLPQPKEDNAIIGDVSKLKNKIDGHVQTFYQTGHANDQGAVHALTQVLGEHSPIPAQRLKELLSNPRSRPNVLRAALAWVIVNKISLESDPRETFLPSNIAGAFNNLPPNRMDERTRMAFLSQWRQITAALTGNFFTQETMAENDSRIENIRNTVQSADQFLAPYANSADHDARLRNLEEIMKRASRLGFLLFSQPSLFRFDWSDNGGGLVVFPALLQTSDDNGNMLPAPRRFSEREVVPV